MKNNTNQIMKLNIPIWIKYWLSKHKNASYILSEILTGTEFFLQDSAPKKFKKFNPIGRTTQESTTGANLQKFNARETATYNYKCDEKGQVTINGNVSSVVTLGYNLSTNLMTLTAGTYKMKVIGNIGSNTLILNNQGSTISLDSNQEATITLNADTSNYYIQIYLNTGTHNDDFYITLASGTTATTERYTGGEPAPNPNYPYAIKNTGDNGSVNEKVHNKNLLILANSSESNGITSTKNSDGSIRLTGTTTATWFTTTGGAFEIPIGTYTFSIDNVINKNCRLGVKYEDNTRATLGTITSGNKSRTFTTSQKILEYYIEFTGVTVGETIDFTIKFQLEEGSTPTSYVPHSEQNLSFPLKQGQKFYEGSYPDDDEKIHHKRNQIIFDGSDDEIWIFEAQGNIYRPRIQISNAKIYSTSAASDAICSHFHYDTKVFNASTIEAGQFAQYRETNLFYFATELTTISEWRQWLSNNPIEIEYSLSQEQTEDFTEEQKTAWEEWKKARTYKNVTHISSEDETPANLKIQYYKEG